MNKNVTIENCMQKKEKGYGVILHDGKAAGFIREDGKDWRERLYGYVQDLRLYVRPRRRKRRKV